MRARSDLATGDVALSRILRTGVAMCFIGHGAFGLLTKKAWVPYFGVVGISEPAAWTLMPWVGAIDVILGVLALFWPCRALFAWAACWTLWTALLRPLAGEGWPEFFERAGNYGVPIAILVLVGVHVPWFARLPEAWPTASERASRRTAFVLRLALVSLLAGHAACALVLRKPALAHHYQVFGVADPANVMICVGWFEALLACSILVSRSPVLVSFACIWKLITELLFVTSSVPAPAFEVIERGGSYIVPLALAWLLMQPRRVPHLHPPQIQPA